MDFPKIPKPMAYAFSIAIIALSLAMSYQVVVGSDITVNGKWGEIKIGDGEDATTVKDFLAKSEEALVSARGTITDQDVLIEGLKGSIDKYQREVSSLKALVQRLTVANNNAQKTRIRADIERTIASINRTYSRTPSVTQSVAAKTTRAKLDKQVSLAQAINKDLLRASVKK